MSTIRPDDVELLDAKETQQLAKELRTLGWAYIHGMHGIHRAERLGTQRLEQASATRDGLLTAVRATNARLSAGD